MKAAQINEYGDASAVQINDIEKPAPQEGQVLVEVYASSLNPFDSAVRSGYMKDMIRLELPVTLGGDMAGVITEVGEGVTGFSIGDKVYGQASVVGGNSGAFAEYAATKTGQIAIAPSNLDFKLAASLPLVGTSALQALTEHFDLKPEHKIFIHGGGGGIGTIAIQVAKNIGAFVATTATGEQIDLVKGFGADDIIDYKSQDFRKVLRGYDAAFDTVGGDEFNKILEVLKDGGIAVSMTAQADEAKAKGLNVTAITQATKVTTARLDKLRELLESGKIIPQVGKVFRLEEIQEAFRARESGAVTGKVVLELKQP